MASASHCQPRAASRRAGNPHPASAKQRLQRSIAARTGEVVLRRDLASFGSPAKFRPAMKQPLVEGQLMRFDTGGYAKAAPGLIFGVPMARLPLGAVVAESSDRLGITW